MYLTFRILRCGFRHVEIYTHDLLKSLKVVSVSFWQYDEISSSPFELVVEPSIADDSAASISAVSMTIATAGVPNRLNALIFEI